EPDARILDLFSLCLAIGCLPRMAAWMRPLRTLTMPRRPRSKLAPTYVDFGTELLVTSAQPPPPHPDERTSIVILSHNQLGYTRLCMESVLRCTARPYELVLVDHGSTDAT